MIIDRNDPQQLGEAILRTMQYEQVSACRAADLIYDDMKTRGWHFSLPGQTTRPPDRPPTGAGGELPDRPESV